MSRTRLGRKLRYQCSKFSTLLVKNRKCSENMNGRRTPTVILVKSLQHASFQLIENTFSSVTSESTFACFARSSLTTRDDSSGHVSVWKPKSAKRLDVRKVSLAEVTAMCGPSRFLWIGRAEFVFIFFLFASSSAH